VSSSSQRAPAARSVGSLLAVACEPLATRHGDFTLHRFLDFERGAPVLVLARGDVASQAPLLARVHSACVTSEWFGACDCDCADQLAGALAAIEREGRGVLVYLLQEGRGAGFVAKARDRMLVQASRERITTFEAYERMGLPHDRRSYREVADALRALRIGAPLVLLTNNPDKLSGLERAKVRVAGATPLSRRASAYSRHYLAAKRRAGHALHAAEHAAPAALPEPVVAFEPHVLRDPPRFAHVASYLLPLRVGEAGDARWVRSEVFYDLARGVERVRLASFADGALRCVQAQRLHDRFPLAAASETRRAWEATRRDLLSRGGRVLFAAPDEDALDAETRRLLDWERPAR
jgi:3,4-dihydroxy 2-butanone 4-phosphate synthase/GTP cyclohydrolase II